MKKPFMTLTGCIAAFAAFAVAPVDGVLTITASSTYKVDVAPDVNLSYRTEELGYIKSGSVTKIVVNGGKYLNLDVDLSDYKGEWDIQGGLICVVAKTGAFGSYRDGTDEVVFSGATAALQSQDTGVVIDKPVRFKQSSSKVGSGDALLRIYGKTYDSTTFKRKLTLEGEYFGIFTQGSIVCEGGLDAPNATIVNSSSAGTWTINVNEVPCDVRGVKLNSCHLFLSAPGNRIGTLDFSEGGMYFHVNCDDSFAADGAPFLTGSNVASMGYAYLNGYDVAVSGVDGTNCTLRFERDAGRESARTTLRIINDEDCVLHGGVWYKENQTDVIKEGKGRLTIGDASYCPQTGGYPKWNGSLTVLDGAVTFESAAVAWTSCTGVTLDGGRLETVGAGNFAESVVVDVTSDEAKDVISVPAGVVNKIARLTVAGVDQGLGSFGSAASGAMHQLDCFDAASTGRFKINKTYVLAFDSTSRTLTDEEKSLFKNNAYNCIQINSRGYQLILDSSLDGYQGEWELLGGEIHICTHDHALGSDSDNMELSLRVNNSPYCAKILMRDGTANRPIVLEGANSTSEVMYFDTVSSNVLEQAVVATGPAKWTYKTGTTTVFYGGVTCPGELALPAQSYTSYVYDKPFDVAGNMATSWGKWSFYAPSNHIGTLTIAASTVNVECDECFSSDTDIVFAYVGEQWNQTLNLNEHDLTCGGVVPCNRGWLDARRSTWPAPADMTVRLNLHIPEGVTNEFPCEGFLMKGNYVLSQDGAGTLKISGSVPFDKEVVTLGGGKLIYTEDAVSPWKLGKLVASADTTFAIAADTVIRPDEFWLGGEKMSPGIYAGANCPDPWKKVLPNFDDDSAGCVRTKNALGLMLQIR